MKNKFSIKYLTLAFASLLLVAVFYSCKQNPVEYEYKQTVINAKAIIKKDCDDKFIISFTNGQSEYCSFGQYNKYQIGDTLCWEREKGWMWYLVDCH